MADIPCISRSEMMEVDRIMVEDLGITLIQIMENAGRGLAGLARGLFLSGDALDKKVIVLAGSGANGGGVLAAARHLSNWGAYLRVYTVRPENDCREVTASQLKTLQLMGVEIFSEAMPQGHEDVDLILDGIIGYNLKGRPRDLASEFICFANACKAPVLSMDVPSGLDATTGEVHEPAIRAAATMTLALPKKGLYDPVAIDVVGDLFLADIGVPPVLYSRSGLGLTVDNIFSKESIVRLR